MCQSGGTVYSVNTKLNSGWSYTDKKKRKFFLIYKEIQMGAVEKSYMTMRKGFLIYCMRKCANI
jgi:hypothetical protein